MNSSHQPIATNCNSLQTSFEDVEELKEYHAGFDIGYGVASSVISLTRDPQVDTQQYAVVVRRMLEAAWTVFRSIENHLAAGGFDRVYVFNGRFAVTRAVLRACQQAGVDCFIHERGCTQGTTFSARTPRRTTSTTSPKTCGAIGRPPGRNPTASKSPATGTTPVLQGRAIFVLLADNKLHGCRAIGTLADTTSRYSSRRKTSSPRSARCGKNPLYESQVAGLRAIIESLTPDPGNVHLYLRIHPNLARVQNEQTRDLAKLHAPFFTAIPAADPVSTYALLREADTVLTFGSTVGIEAVYWGTPAVLAGKSRYRDFGVTYNPQTHEEVIDLLRRPLQPHPIEPALVYAYYWATYGIPFRYFESEGFYQGRFKGRRIIPAPLDRAKMAVLSVAFPSRLLRRARKALAHGVLALRNQFRRAA